MQKMRGLRASATKTQYTVTKWLLTSPLQPTSTTKLCGCQNDAHVCIRLLLDLPHALVSDKLHFNLWCQTSCRCTPWCRTSCTQITPSCRTSCTSPSRCRTSCRCTPWCRTSCRCIPLVLDEFQVYPLVSDKLQVYQKRTQEQTLKNTTAHTCEPTYEYKY
jgi:hypothetical protein